MDYTLPRADDFAAEWTLGFTAGAGQAPIPLGAKGVGELGPAGAMAPVVHHAVHRRPALPGRHHTSDMPLTPSGCGGHCICRRPARRKD